MRSYEQINFEYMRAIFCLLTWHILKDTRTTVEGQEEKWGWYFDKCSEVIAVNLLD